MVRLFAVEQIYRAIAILKGEPYHNEWCYCYDKWLTLWKLTNLYMFATY
jgi:hypothetical protein